MNNLNFNSIRLLYLAHVANSSFFLAVCLFLKERRIEENDILVYFGMIIAIPAILLGLNITKYFAKTKKENQNQLLRYRMIKMIQGAILNGSALVNLVAFFLTGNQNSMYTGIVIIIVLISRFPTEKEMNELLPPPKVENKNIDDRF